MRKWIRLTLTVGALGLCLGGCAGKKDPPPEPNRPATNDAAPVVRNNNKAVGNEAPVKGARSNE